MKRTDEEVNGVKTIELYNGKKRWQSTIEIPVELVEDNDYLEHIKLELKERCVKEYIREIEDSFKYGIETNRTSRQAIVKITMEDLFGLKRQNEALNRELRELVDKYRALKNKNER